MIYSHITTTIWDRIPHIFNWSHRKLLTLNFETKRSVYIHDDELDEILQLIKKGFDIRIFESGQDYLQKIYTQEPSLADPDESDI